MCTMWVGNSRLVPKIRRSEARANIFTPPAAERWRTPWQSSSMVDAAVALSGMKAVA